MRDVEEPVYATSALPVYVTYSQRELYDVRTVARGLTSDLIKRVCELGLRAVDRPTRRGRSVFTRYRGRRPVPSLRAAGDGAYLLTGNKRQRSAVSPTADSASTGIPALIRIHPNRPAATIDTLVFGCINIRSLANKVDDVSLIHI